MIDKAIKFGKFKLGNKVTFFLSLVFLLIAIYYLSIEIESSVFIFKQHLNQIYISEFLLSLVAVFLLQFLNWFLEALKFKILINNFSKTSLLFVLKSIYVGNFTAFFTPERFGNFIGRAIVFKEKKEEVIMATLIGNLSQLIITVIIGLFSMFFLKSYLFEKLLGLNSFYFLPILLYFFLLIFLLFIFFSHKSINYFLKIRVLTKWIIKFKDLNFVDISHKLSVLLFALLRYLVFYFQYLILATALDFQIDYFMLFLFVGLLFGLVTFIPSPLPGNLGTREGLAAFLFGGGLLGIQFSFISFLIWLINVGFSTVLGGIIYSFSNLKK